jgi:hypothetical protein
MDGTRRRVLYQLNSRWIYGKIVSGFKPWAHDFLLILCVSEQPLLHAAVFLLQMAAVSLLARKYNQYYGQRPGKTGAKPSDIFVYTDNAQSSRR